MKTERMFYDALRSRLAPMGFYMRYQYTIVPFCADIFVHPYWVVEVDGPEHNYSPKRELDAARTAALEAAGKKLIRITNAEVLEDLKSAVDIVANQIAPPIERDKTILRRKYIKSENGRILSQ